MNETAKKDLIELKKLQTCLTRVKEIDNQIEQNQAALEESEKKLKNAQKATFSQKNEHYKNRLSIENEDKKQRQIQAFNKIHRLYLLCSIIYAFITYRFIDIQTTSTAPQLVIEVSKIIVNILFYLGITISGSIFYTLTFSVDLPSKKYVALWLKIVFGFFPIMVSLLVTFSKNYYITLIHMLITFIFTFFIRTKRVKAIGSYTSADVKNDLENAKLQDINAEKAWEAKQNQKIKTLTQEHENVKLSAPQNIERLEKEKELLKQSIKQIDTVGAEVFGLEYVNFLIDQLSNVRAGSLNEAKKAYDKQIVEPIRKAALCAQLQKENEEFFRDLDRRSEENRRQRETLDTLKEINRKLNE